MSSEFVDDINFYLFMSSEFVDDINFYLFMSSDFVDDINFCLFICIAIIRAWKRIYLVGIGRNLFGYSLIFTTINYD